MKTYELHWGPTGQKLGTVTASTVKLARSKAPLPYRKYKGEIGVTLIGNASNPGKATRKRRRSVTSHLRVAGHHRAKGPMGNARYQYKLDSSVRRGRLTKSPASQPEARRNNPKRRGATKVYNVKVPRSATMPGYQLTIRANLKRTAIAEARAYCVSKHGTAPRGIKATEARAA